jgi:hypothetical protein
VSTVTTPRTAVRLTPVRLAVPLAAGVAVAALAAAEQDPTAAAEGGYLAVLTTAALLPVAALAPEPARELGLGAVLAAAAAWALPAGPARGAALLAVLAATLAVAAGRQLGRSLPDLPFATALALTLGAQVLLRGDLLLASAVAPRTVVILIVLPAVAAAALARLALRHGGERALLAGTAALLLGPGWNVASTAALAALAAGDLLAAPPVRLLRLPGGRRTVQVAAALILLAPLLWQQRAGALIALAGLTLASPLAGAAGALLATAAAAFLPLPAGEAAVFSWWLWLPLLLPALVLPDRTRLPLLAAALLLASATRAVPGEAALAPAVALAALALRRPAQKGTEGGAPLAVQGVWSGTLLAGTALLAAYPWLRERPVADAVDLLGPAPAVAVTAVVAAALLGGALPALLRREPAAGPWRVAALAAGAAGAALALALLLRLPAPGRQLVGPERAIVLDAAHPGRTVPLDGRAVAGLTFTSSLLNGAELAAGTPVATVRLHEGAGTGGGEVAWTLRAGIDTGEWAARRPDIRGRTAAPPGWVCFVAGDFFGQRYRSRLMLPLPRRFTRVSVDRAADLPPGVAVALHEVRLLEEGL